MYRKDAAVLQAQHRVAKQIILSKIVERLHRLRAHTTATTFRYQSLTVCVAFFLLFTSAWFYIHIRILKQPKSIGYLPLRYYD